MQMHKLGVIVPFRDRYEHLVEFKAKIVEYLNKQHIQYELIIVEQDDAKLFNRGKLLNIGFKYAKKLGCDYVAFHDVDMIPIDVDYSYSETPTHLSSKFISKDPNFKRIVFDEYFGGVTLFPIEMFEVINGYSNDYWGWGYEDDDLLHRCKLVNIPLDSKEIMINGSNTAALKFNGIDAHVAVKNIVNITQRFSIFVSFYPDELICDHKKMNDIFTIFSIPGYDFRITYNGFRRYATEIFTRDSEIIYINSDIKPNYKTNIVVTVDPTLKLIQMYQDGNLIGYEYYEASLYNYNREKNFYLGCANIDTQNKIDETYFKGLLNSFAIYDGILSEKEIKEISTNKYFGLTQNFGEYQSADNLKLYYDAKFIKGYELMDLSGKGNNGKISKCEIVGLSYDETKIIQIPHRRDCTFLLLSHDENGYVRNSWKDVTTRYNQLKFHNEMQQGYRNYKLDGLSDCKYREHSNTAINNQTHINVSI